MKYFFKEITYNLVIEHLKIDIFYCCQLNSNFEIAYMTTPCNFIRENRANYIVPYIRPFNQNNQLIFTLL